MPPVLCSKPPNLVREVGIINTGASVNTVGSRRLCQIRCRIAAVQEGLAVFLQGVPGPPVAIDIRVYVSKDAVKMAGRARVAGVRRRRRGEDQDE